MRRALILIAGTIFLVLLARVLFDSVVLGVAAAIALAAFSRQHEDLFDAMVAIHESRADKTRDAADRKRQVEQFAKDTENNPTIR